MANQSNQIQFQSIGLLNQTASFIITRDLQNSENVDDSDRSDVNSMITNLWSKLKHSPQDFSLEHIMSNIEKSFAMEQQESGNFPLSFSADLKDDLLTKNVNVLFKKLAEKFRAKRIFGSSIPVDISSYARLQRVSEDDALQTIWDLCLVRQLVFKGPIPVSLDEIKAWLKNPTNATQLNSIQTLELSRLGLRAIPPEISAFTQLHRLSLDNNQISSIPDSLSNLSQLEQLDLNYNQIVSIPNSLSNLSQLQELGLANNQISSIPDSLSNLSQLQRLFLDRNQISSIPDSLGNFSQLQRLYLNNNQISSIPDSLSNLSQLEQLDLNYNQIVSIPNSLSNLSQLQLLNFGNNQISIIPDSLSNLSQLEWLSFDNNQISSIPDSLSNLSQLEQLDLNYNQIVSIPDSLSNLSQLQLLNLGNNQISIIPDSLSNLSQLEWLSFDNNQISSIPDSLSNFFQIRELYLADNQISSIPDSLGNLSQLDVLFLQNNQICNIPGGLSKLFQIECFSFDDNPLLFIYDKNSIPSKIPKLVAQCSEFKEYKCLSSFSNLCQLIVLKNDNHEVIKGAFGNLKKSDQNLIFEMVCKKSGVHSNDHPISWGEHHVFDDMNIFYHAVKKAIAAKFNRLSLKEQNAVYEEIDQLAQPKIEDPKWGEQHAFDNVLRFIDAMDRIGS
jgi:Leucine-rich repeat (LRR) protein